MREKISYRILSVFTPVAEQREPRLFILVLCYLTQEVHCQISWFYCLKKCGSNLHLLGVQINPKTCFDYSLVLKWLSKVIFSILETASSSLIYQTLLSFIWKYLKSKYILKRTKNLMFTEVWVPETIFSIPKPNLRTDKSSSGGSICHERKRKQSWWG